MKQTNVNLANIVYRLMTSHRGWRVDDLMASLEIQDRTYRKYRLRLQEEFVPFWRPDGTSRIAEVVDGEARYLRLVDVGEHGWSDTDFIARVTALHFAQRLLGFLSGTEVGDAIDAFLGEFEHSMRDRRTMLSDVLHHADRMFYEIPDAPKDYSDKGPIVRTLLRAMMSCRKVSVEYESASNENVSALVLSPLTLASHRSALYVFARTFHYEDVRMYAVDRIKSVEATTERFEYPSEVAYDPARYAADSWGVFRGEDGERHDFELVFANKRWLKMFVRERRWHRSQTLEELDDGRLRLRFTVSSDREVWPWIRGFGEDVEVLAPASDG